MTMTQAEFETAIENRFKERERLYDIGIKIHISEYSEIEGLKYDIDKLKSVSSSVYDVDSIIDEMEHDLKQKQKELINLKAEWKKLKSALDGDSDAEEDTKDVADFIKKYEKRGFKEQETLK